MPDSVVGPGLAAVRAPVGVVRGAGRGVALTVAARGGGLGHRALEGIPGAF